MIQIDVLIEMPSADLVHLRAAHMFAADYNPTCLILKRPANTDQRHQRGRILQTCQKRSQVVAEKAKVDAMQEETGAKAGPAAQAAEGWN